MNKPKPSRSRKAAPKRTAPRPKSIEELAAEQGVALPQKLDEMIGKGRDLWDSDEDFDNFLAFVRNSRRF